MAARSCAAISLALVFAFTILGWPIDYDAERNLWWLRCTGYTAFAALLLALCVTPLRKLAILIAPLRVAPGRLLAFRRSLGLTSAFFALMHAGIFLATMPYASFRHVLHHPHLRSGLFALIILALLGATSYPRLVRVAGIRLWGNLHWLAYVSAVLVFQHLFLSPYASRRVILGLALTFVVICFGRLLRQREEAGPAVNRVRAGERGRA